jgi:hypothetical protein
MVEGLLPHVNEQAINYTEEMEPIRPILRIDHFSESDIVEMIYATMLEFVFVQNGINFWLHGILLALGKYSTIGELPRIGVELLANPRDWNDGLQL